MGDEIIINRYEQFKNFYPLNKVLLSYFRLIKPIFDRVVFKSWLNFKPESKLFPFNKLFE